MSVYDVNFGDLPRATRAAIRQARRIEAEYFNSNPTSVQFERAFIPGEAPDMPPSTRVVVFRFAGNRVARAYAPDVRSN